MGDWFSHDEIVRQLFFNPIYLGIHPNIVLGKSMEHHLFLRQQLYVVPDIYFITPDRDVYVEVKSANNNSCINSGLKQLDRIKEWLQYYKVRKPSECLLVYPKHHHIQRFQTLENTLRIELN